jgi:hypothetical protein
MNTKFAHIRMLPFPFSGSPAGGHLDSLHQERRGSRADLIMDYQELRLTAPLVIAERDGKLWENVQGEYISRRVRFTDIQFHQGAELCDILPNLPADHLVRVLLAALFYRAFEGANYYIVSHRSAENPDLVLTARRCLPEERPGTDQKAAFERDWSPCPPCPPGLMPFPRGLYRRFGGDPIHFWMDGKLQRRRLFLGGREIQEEQRPRELHTVFNYGDEPSRWVEKAPPHPKDYWIKKGEGSAGMSASELGQEAQGVIERLRAGERVLVHCSAGMNRSSTVCCAVLILLEGLTAEAALERVRQNHPWARPDPRYWLTLRWLAQNQGAVTNHA